jgi:hypothetical protein
MSDGLCATSPLFNKPISAKLSIAAAQFRHVDSPYDPFLHPSSEGNIAINGRPSRFGLREYSLNYFSPVIALHMRLPLSIACFSSRLRHGEPHCLKTCCFYSFRFLAGIYGSKRRLFRLFKIATR